MSRVVHNRCNGPFGRFRGLLSGQFGFTSTRLSRSTLITLATFSILALALLIFATAGLLLRDARASIQFVIGQRPLGDRGARGLRGGFLPGHWRSCERRSLGFHHGFQVTQFRTTWTPLDGFDDNSLRAPV
jgi:hypothetical protein